MPARMAGAAVFTEVVASVKVKAFVPESFLAWAEPDVRLFVAWITPLNRRGTLTAERGFVAHLLFTAGVTAHWSHQIVFLNYYLR